MNTDKKKLAALSHKFGDHLLKNEMPPLSVFTKMFLSRECPGTSDEEQDELTAKIYAAMAEAAVTDLSRAIVLEWDSLQTNDTVWVQDATYYYHRADASSYKLRRLLEHIDQEECDHDAQPVGNHRRHFTAAVRGAAFELYKAMGLKYEAMVKLEPADMMP